MIHASLPSPTDSSSTVLALLDAERASLLARVAQLPPALQTRRPTPDRWSVVEVLEHLARVERGIAKLLVVRGQETPPGLAAELAEAQLTAERIARLRSRSERLVAPDRIQPAGTSTPSEALTQLDDARRALRSAFLGAAPASLDGLTHQHPVLGALTLRAWVEFVAHHEARHADQIQEIIDALTGPAQ